MLECGAKCKLFQKGLKIVLIFTSSLLGQDKYYSNEAQTTKTEPKLNSAAREDKIVKRNDSWIKEDAFRDAKVDF